MPPRNPPYDALTRAVNRAIASGAARFLNISQDDSTTLKRGFKDHFAAHGIDAPLPDLLANGRAACPNEWAEACEEFERDHGGTPA